MIILLTFMCSTVLHAMQQDQLEITSLQESTVLEKIARLKESYAHEVICTSSHLLASIPHEKLALKEIVCRNNLCPMLFDPSQALYYNETTSGLHIISLTQADQDKHHKTNALYGKSSITILQHPTQKAHFFAVQFTQKKGKSCSRFSIEKDPFKKSSLYTSYIADAKKILPGNDSFLNAFFHTDIITPHDSNGISLIKTENYLFYLNKLEAFKQDSEPQKATIILSYEDGYKRLKDLEADIKKDALEKQISKEQFEQFSENHRLRKYFFFDWIADILNTQETKKQSQTITQ